MSQANQDRQNVNKDINRWTVSHHHHFIACRDYERTMTKKVQSLIKSPTPTGQSQQTTSKRIMLVEDNEDINSLFLTVLQDADRRLNVDAFTDPYVALENFRPTFYDLLLIDIVMPKMDGFELYRRIRRLDDKVKVCFLTASQMYCDEIRKEVFPELGVNCFIAKPIANEDLVRRVKEVLELQ